MQETVLCAQGLLCPSPTQKWLPKAQGEDSSECCAAGCPALRGPWVLVPTGRQELPRDVFPGGEVSLPLGTVKSPAPGTRGPASAHSGLDQICPIQESSVNIFLQWLTTLKSDFFLTIFNLYSKDPNRFPRVLSKQEKSCTDPGGFVAWLLSYFLTVQYPPSGAKAFW